MQINFLDYYYLYNFIKNDIQKRDRLFNGEIISSNSNGGYRSLHDSEYS